MDEINRPTLELLQHSTQLRLLLILAVTALVRIAFLLLFAYTLSFQTSGYDTYATHLMDGRGYTRYDDRNADSDLPPLYPFFLVGTYTLLGRNPISVASVQIGFDLLTTLLLYLIGKRIKSAQVGLLSAVFYGLYPYLLFQNLTLNDSGIFILLLVLGIWLAYRARDTSHSRYAAALGVVFGLAALTKTFVIALMPLLGLWWYRQVGLRNSVRLSLASGIMLVAIIAPWVARNISVQGEFVLISTNDGSNFHQGNNACVADYLARGWDAQWVDCLEPEPSGLSEFEAARWHSQQAISFLLEHLSEWPRLFGTKLLVLWSPAITPSSVPPNIPLTENAVLLYQTPMFQLARIVHLLYFGPLLVLGLVGLIWAWHNELPIGPLVSVFVVITAVYVIFHPSTRYRSPADSFLFILSAYAVTQLRNRVRLRSQKDQPLAAWPVEKSMDDRSYAEKLAHEAEVWGSVAEQQASTLPPDWRYHRALRHNVIMHTVHIDALLSHVHPGSSVLELGCSSGWLTLGMAQRGARAHGIDIGEKAVQIARAYYDSVKEKVPGTATYQVADLNTTDLPAEYYDVVAVKGVLHHLLNLESVIDRIYKVLKPGGLLWIADVNGDETMPVVLIASALTFVLPTQVPYRHKIKGLLRFGVRAPERIKASMQASGLSPFEGVARQQDWLKLISRRFTVEQRIDHPAFTGYVTAEIKLPDRFALPLLRIMHKLDSVLVRHKILHSTGVTLYARKHPFMQRP